ncbi:MAG: glycosyltransferase [Burkholderiales bacterium]|nr:MAG: glycosyltransferase [Burkholderiales bacterium]
MAPAVAPRLVSVAVPTRNRPDTLRLALQSIRALEGPDLKFEILVGDNGDMPETKAVTEEFGGVYVRASDGCGPGRNAGMRIATGDYIAFLDDDDVFLPANIRPHLAILEARPELDAVIGQLIKTDPNLENHSAPAPDGDPGQGDALTRSLLGGFFPQMGTTVARASVMKKDGLFDESLVYGQDLDWQLRIARRGAMGYTPTPCILFRGRASGTYDNMALKRVQFDRRVFLRHALPEWRIWRSPIDFLKAYTRNIEFFYWYFAHVAGEHLNRGDNKKAAAAVKGALYVFPLRGMVHLITRPQFRRALLAGLFGKQAAKASARS